MKDEREQENKPDKDEMSVHYGKLKAVVKGTYPITLVVILAALLIIYFGIIVKA